jgi:hypothetical protein
MTDGQLSLATTAADDERIAAHLAANLYAPLLGPGSSQLALRLLREGVPDVLAFWGHLTLAEQASPRRGLEVPLAHARAAADMARNIWQGQRNAAHESGAPAPYATRLVQASCLVADITRRMGNVDQALEDLRRLKGGDGIEDTPHLRGWILLHQGRADLATSNARMAASQFSEAAGLIWGSDAEQTWVAYALMHQRLGDIVSGQYSVDELEVQLRTLKKYMSTYQVDHGTVAYGVQLMEKMLEVARHPQYGPLADTPMSCFTHLLRAISIM